MVEKQSTTLSVPRNAVEAKQIAKHGDSVVPFLSDMYKLDATSATSEAACVHALIHIGTATALEAIERIASKSSLNVVWKQLFRGITVWPDTDAYVSAIFKQPMHVGLGRHDTWVATKSNPPPARLRFKQAVVLIRFEIVEKCSSWALTDRQTEQVRQAGWEHKNHVDGNGKDMSSRRCFMKRIAQ